MKYFIIMFIVMLIGLIIKHTLLNGLIEYNLILDLLLFSFVSLIVYFLVRKNERYNSLLQKKLDTTSLKIEKLYYYDSLTNLPNRNKLLEEIKSNKYCEMILTNIDNFKEVNEFYGYKMGDYIIDELSKMIIEYFTNLGNIDIYRMPGDEFAICFKKEIGNTIITKRMKEFSKKIKRKIFEFENDTLQINISLGASRNKDFLLQYSDIALKKAQKNIIEYLCLDENFSINNDLENNIEWTKKIRWAISNDRIVPFFQPIYSNIEQKIVKYECLVRLVDKEDKVISPFFFLEKAVKAKLYFKITKIMIAKCFKYFKDKDVEFSINLSYLDIINNDVKKFLIANIKLFPNPRNINIELLETQEVESYESVKEFISEIKEYGCKIAIDDFGVGYSNFNHIVELNIDIIKIDASLVKGIAENKDLEIIVETISSFANKIGVQSVGEFVYSKEIADKLIKLGVTMSQGYYYGKPLAYILPTDQPILEEG